MLTLRPPGRGNWTPIVLAVQPQGKTPPPMFIAVNQRITLGGVVYRIAKVTT